MSQTVQVGKAKLTVDVKGCVKCGTERSSGWKTERMVDVTVRQGRGRESKLIVQAHICADCSRPENVISLTSAAQKQNVDNCLVGNTPR